MAQPAAAPQRPQPTASHPRWLKDTGTEGPSECDYSQRDPDFTGDGWSLSSHRLMLHRIRGLWYELEPAGRENG